MELSALLAKCLAALRQFVAPRYRPEHHQMRDTRRAILVESKRVLPLLRNPRR
ncbi:msl0996 [Mesorhizobium japonicum MAFF 303099]|uniref:Msl0996 protein n=1 Tax=Mesorhizobium japonicum (strain LMG 29417 / CECT 9101 / MAFF 303099) TaxID=266835 RepID=Q98LJ6_RHILO|nr:msl0996 [Mesorhizobium japonicum MAFF 303099]